MPIETSETTAPREAPACDADPFSDEFLTDPYAHRDALQASPVVFLPRYGTYAMARHDEVHATLNDWGRFCSGAGVGLTDFRKERPWRTPSLILEVDPPDHTRARAVLARILSPGVVRVLRETFEREAESMVERLVTRGRFDGIVDLAQAFPLKVFPDALGLTDEARDNLLLIGDLNFNGFGPRNALFERSFERAQPALPWLTEKFQRHSLAPGGFGAQAFAAADAGDFDLDKTPTLVRSFLLAGIDTTVNGLGNALFCLATHPDAWAELRADPSRARGAFDEAIRHEAPVQTFFRTTTCDVEVSGVKIPKDSKVLLFLGLANRDPRRWPDPDRYDIARSATGHVGFGTGLHGCIGQMIARLEGEVVLKALATRVELLKLERPPVRRLNNTLRGLASLPFHTAPS